MRPRSYYWKTTRRVCQRVAGDPLTSGDDERVFLIDEGLLFDFRSSEAEPSVSWRDLSGDESDRWELVSAKVCPNIDSEVTCSLCQGRLTVCSS